MRVNYQIGLFILLTLFFSSCVSEDMPYCDVFIEFKYDFNEDGTDKILEEVEMLDLLIFLNGDSLYKRISIQPQKDGTSILVPLEGGTYHFVTWGNVPPSTHQETSYRYDINTGKLIYQSEVITYQDTFSLFYGNSTDAFKIDGDTYISREVSLINNTKQIDIVINGNFSVTTCELFAENCNHDNENTPSSLLNSIYVKDTIKGMERYRFSTHRLVPDLTKTGFSFSGHRTGQPELPEIFDCCLIELLLRGNEPSYGLTDLEYLDSHDHYVIMLDFGPFGGFDIIVNPKFEIEMPEDL